MLGKGLEYKAQGYLRIMSALQDIPAAFTLFWSSDSDVQKMLNFGLNFWDSRQDIFWSHLETWAAARLQIIELTKVYDYPQAGEVFAKALIKAMGGPVPDFSNDQIVKPTVKPIEVEAASIFAGLLYGITQRENLD